MCKEANVDGPLGARSETNRYLPAIGRFLIVVTFLEDALRIITQWSEQLSYLHDYRRSMSGLFILKEAKLLLLYSLQSFDGWLIYALTLAL